MIVREKIYSQSTPSRLQTSDQEDEMLNVKHSNLNLLSRFSQSLSVMPLLVGQITLKQFSSGRSIYSLISNSQWRYTLEQRFSDCLIAGMFWAGCGQLLKNKPFCVRFFFSQNIGRKARVNRAQLAATISTIRLPLTFSLLSCVKI